MPRSRNLLIVIADGEHVRFVRPAEDNALHSEAPAQHQRSADLGGDHPGASTGSSAHHALARGMIPMRRQKSDSHTQSHGDPTRAARSTN